MIQPQCLLRLALETFLKGRKGMHEELITIPAFDQVSVYQEPACNDGSTIEDLIASFAKAKFARTQSTKAAKAYVESLHGFRRYLREQGLNLIATLKGSQPMRW